MGAGDRLRGVPPAPAGRRGSFAAGVPPPLRRRYARLAVLVPGFAGRRLRRARPGRRRSARARAARSRETSRRPRPPIENTATGGATIAARLDAAFTSRGVAPGPAELFRDLDRSDSNLADRLARAVTGFPPVGSTFLGFRLESELGRGAFGRVYLARQGDLANRPVALKISADVIGETHALAQLRHTNIVPIYSVHRSGPLQAVCMPYLGSGTFADVLRELKQSPTLPDSGAGLLSSRHRRSSASGVAAGELARGRRHGSAEGSASGDEGTAAAATRPPEIRATAQLERIGELGYVQAVLWLVARLADGLAHAHERGILHRDLKPANILLGDDGEPLLLDFNLAADTKLRSHASAALIGGTLPYMAPEHLEALQGRDSPPRCPERPLLPRRDPLRAAHRAAPLPDPHRAGPRDPAADDRRTARAAAPVAPVERRGSRPPSNRSSGTACTPTPRTAIDPRASCTRTSSASSTTCR